VRGIETTSIENGTFAAIPGSWNEPRIGGSVPTASLFPIDNVGTVQLVTATFIQRDN